ncbi:uncharacterized protein VNE69_03327 [Vairimorpha necatrix]|uniref:Uncharacterized protein n=1 Tax=Vairimorpha necatrix TaxID=6039 RepID=A0AAX4JAW8_9MICR
MCSNLYNVKNKLHATTGENNYNSIKNIVFPKCQKLLIRKNMNTKEQASAHDSGNTSSIRFNSYKKDNSLPKSPFNSDVADEPLDLSIKSENKKTIDMVHKNDQDKIKKYNLLLDKLKSCIDTWNNEDIQCKNLFKSLRFKNKEYQKLYEHNSIRLYPWMKAHACIVNDYLIRIVPLISKCKIEQNLKELLCLQIQFIYKAMSYAQKLFPFKENYKPLSGDLIMTYVSITIRLPILMCKLHLQSGFFDFFQTLSRHQNNIDPVYLELCALTNSLYHKVIAYFEGFVGFFKINNKMMDILKRAQLEK